jgi:predicted small metal-binding protein
MQSMAKFACADYGFECRYEVEGEEKDVVGKFMTHSSEEHGIEYSYDTLKQFLLRKTDSTTSPTRLLIDEQDTKTIISILDFASTFLPLSTISDGKIDNQIAQRLIVKLSESLPCPVSA